MSDNVISIEQKKRELATRQNLARRLSGQFKELTRKHMQRVLQGMFDNADDTLFKMAEKAGGEGQQLYFDSMRIVRLQRSTIETNFFLHMEQGFVAFKDDSADTAPDDSQPDFQNLELVSESDLEVTLAIENLEHKIRSRYQSELSAIQKRLAWLYDAESWPLEDIPFAPGALVDAYFQAAEAADLALEIKLILLKLFDWHCLHGFYELYHEINEVLIDAGVLPVIKATLKNTGSYSGAENYPQGQTPPAAAYPGNAESGVPPGNVFDTLQALLADQRGYPGQGPRGYAGGGTAGQGHGGSGQGAGAPGGFGGGVGGGGIGTGPVVVMSNEEVMQSLTTLQQDADMASPVGGAHALGNFVRAQLQGGTEENRQLHPVDSDAIDVVCLIFEYILDDPQLPATARASIARLQIPMLKVAMLDKQFFALRAHPARSLLNHLAKAALGIDEAEDPEKNPVLAKIDEVVNEVLAQFTDDLALFEQLDKDFCEFIERHHSQEQQTKREIEQRQQQREELALARAWVRETLEQHLLGRTLPKPVVDIILGPWKDVMLHTYMQEGDDSLLWKNQIRFIDVLCWSVEPKQLRLDRQKLANIIRQLILTLREGLQRIDYPPAEVDAIFVTLEPYHLASVRGEAYGRDGAPSLPPSLARDVPEADELGAATGDPDEGHPVPDAPVEDKVIMEEIVLEGWEQDAFDEQVDDEYLQLARHLEAGKWVEFKDAQGNARRAKLAWKSELLGEYTFLNWKFDVVADKSLQELAADLRAGTAQVIDDLPLMDRALAGVMNALTPKAR